MKKNTKVTKWWQEMSVEEQYILINMLFEMDLINMEEFGVSMDGNGKYVKK